MKAIQFDPYSKSDFKITAWIYTRAGKVRIPS